MFGCSLPDLQKHATMPNNHPRGLTRALTRACNVFSTITLESYFCEYPSTAQPCTTMILSPAGSER